MTHYLTLESIWLISLSLFPYMHKYDSSFIISPMDMAILHAKLVWLSVATITTSFSIWLRLSIETLNQYSQNESWLRLSIETLNHPPKTTIVPSPSLFVTVTNEDRDWPVRSSRSTLVMSHHSLEVIWLVDSKLCVNADYLPKLKILKYNKKCPKPQSKMFQGVCVWPPKPWTSLGISYLE